MQDRDTGFKTGFDDFSVGQAAKSCVKHSLSIDYLKIDQRSGMAGDRCGRLRRIGSILVAGVGLAALAAITIFNLLFFHYCGSMGQSMVSAPRIHLLLGNTPP